MKDVIKAIGKLLKWFVIADGAAWAFLGIGHWFNKVCDEIEEDLASFNADVSFGRFIDDAGRGFKRYFGKVRDIFR